MYIQTETVLRQALTERIKPVAIIDRVLLELQLTKEDLYKIFIINKITKKKFFYFTIESINIIISTYYDSDHGDVQIYPEKGTVAFGSSLQGWGFTISQFAQRYSKKFGVDKEKMM